MKKILRAEYFAVLIVFIILFILFFVPPSAGVSDNGDFQRIMNSTGIVFEYDVAKNYFFDYCNPIYHIYKNDGTFKLMGVVTSQIIPITIAKKLNMMFYSKENFHLLWLAWLYSILFLFAIYFIVKNIKTKNRIVNIILTALCIWIFADSTYTVYFNSFYGEAFSYVTLLLMFGLGLELIQRQGKNSLLFIITFLITAGLFFSSKLQYMCLSFLLLLTPLFIKRFQKTAFVISLALILMCIVLYNVAPKQLYKDTLYNSFFYGVLKNSPDVDKDLAYFKLPSYMHQLAGTTAYDRIDIEKNQLEKDFYDKISRKDIICFYITHPKRFIKKMDITTRKAFDNTIGMNGNFTKDAGFAPKSHNVFFTSFNFVKQIATPKSFVYLVILYIFYLGFLLINFMKAEDTIKKRKILLSAMIMFIGIIQFPLPILGNGEADIAKQLYIFNLTFDMAFLYLIRVIMKFILSNKG